MDNVKLWIELFFSYLHKFDEMKINERTAMALISLISDQSLYEIFQKILSIHLYSNKQIKECYISTCGIHSIDENINEVKGKTFEWFFKLYNVFCKNFLENHALKSFFTSNINGLLSSSIRSLITFCIHNSGSFQTFLENKKNEIFLIKILNFINICIPFIDYFETIFNLKAE